MADTKRVLGSLRVIRLGLFISKHVPPGVGYGLVRWVVGLIVRLRPRLYWVIRANLSQALGLDVANEALHAAVHRTLIHAGRAYYDHFHAQGLGRDEVIRQAGIAPAVWEAYQRAQAEGRGIVMVSGHVSNLDLAAMSLVFQGAEVQ
ncbi:MAG: hypothetical protein GX605_08185, partial [Chloroflexi bacterium]|nr:hypothetical protein [Chloroflexota bacterium]